MIIIGDEYIPFETIENIKTIEDIKSTKPNSTLIFNFNKDIMVYCINNSIEYAVKVNSIVEIIYANGLEAKYILPNNSILEISQKLADSYMFDSKILATISKIEEIEDIAIKEIDGVIYNSLL
ncbi:MAG: hypothetical protein U9Q30_04065 [Campylobacterota bacterium]|nr:hypothetical protein [Campylobacterota bacterium]